MARYLPYGNFRWDSQDKLSRYTPEFIQAADEFPPEDFGGLIFDVDLEYPEELHEKHNSLPLCAENVTITWDMLSPWAKKVWKELGGTTSYKSRKLTATFLDKKHYVCAWENLAFYLKMGLKLKKIHRVLHFDERAFIEPHVRDCVDGRRSAKSKVEENMYKGLSNFLYGKMIENPANRVDCKFVQTEKEVNKRLKDPTIRSTVVCSEKLAMTFHRKKKLELNQNWAVGFTILEYSKLFMIRSYYEDIQPKFPGNVRILASDTDSFILLVRHSGHNIDHALEKFRTKWDFSQLPANHKFYNTRFKHQIGRFKLESNPCVPIIAFAGLKSKSYCVKDVDDDVNRRAKGIRTSFQKMLTFNDYKSVILNGGKKTIEQFSLQTKDHVTKTVKTTKTCFTAFDDKRK